MRQAHALVRATTSPAYPFVFSGLSSVPNSIRGAAWGNAARRSVGQCGAARRGAMRRGAAWSNAARGGTLGALGLLRIEFGSELNPRSDAGTRKHGRGSAEGE